MAFTAEPSEASRLAAGGHPLLRLQRKSQPVGCPSMEVFPASSPSQFPHLPGSLLHEGQQASHSVSSLGCGAAGSCVYLYLREGAVETSKKNGASLVAYSKTNTLTNSSARGGRWSIQWCGSRLWSSGGCRRNTTREKGEREVEKGEGESK